MSDSGRRINVLICEPGAPGGSVFLPYVWAILKSYFERHGSAVGAVNWLDPLFERERVLSQAADLREAKIDVVGLSCYTWNWHLNVQLARCMKESHPNAIVVAGGPDPDYNDPAFFQKYPDIDAVVIKDGEVPFTRILDGLAAGSLDLTSIPGLALPSPSLALPVVDGVMCDQRPRHLFTGNAQLPAAFDHSPYLLQVDRLREMVADCSGHVIAATLETNRGCPYSCNYCDWGSATMSKLRKFDEARIHADIETLAALRVNWVFQADANFGILPRDIEIAELLVKTHRERGFPQSLVYSTAKNNPDRTVEISRRLHDGGIVREHWLAVQHTDEEVLKTADRSNISAAKYREVAASLRTHGVPCFPQLILGMPGDTLEKWKTCVTTMMEWGIHDHYWVSAYSLLPNAPAAAPDFLRSWKVETLERELVDAWSLRLKDAHEALRSRLVVAFEGYTKSDWVEASTYTAQVRGLHNLPITRLPAIYLRSTYGVPYREIYDALIDDFIGRNAVWNAIQSRVRSVYQALLADANAVDHYPLADYPDQPYYVNPSKGVFIDVARRLDAFMDDLKCFLERRFPHAREIASVVDYQRHLVLSSRHDPRRPHRFGIRHDWPTYFAAVDRSGENTHVPPPRRFLVPRTATVPTHPAGRVDGAGGELGWLKHILAQPNMAATANHPHPRIGLASHFWSAHVG